jgi:hypothetical protein
MWMIFTGQASPVYGMMNGSLGLSVSASNSIIGVAGGYIRFFSFAQDFAWLYDTSAKYSFANQNLVNRNAYSVSGSTPTLVSGGVASNTTNDVAMIVLPNASIDSATGLPVPTIAIATAGGVSVIRDNGVVYNVVETAGPNSVHRITFRKDNKKIFIYTSGTPGITTFPQAYAFDIPNRSYSIGYFYEFSPTTIPGFEFWGVAWDNVGLFGNKINVPTGGTLSDISSSDLANTSGLFRLLLNNDITRNSAHAQVTSKYNTGYMIGDIKGAWLSDTTQETVVSTELITNGTFDSNTTTGWVAFDSTLTASSNQMTIARTGGNGNAAYQTFTTEQGKTYLFSAKINSVGSRGDFYIRNGGNTGAVLANLTGTNGQTVTLIGQFTAISSQSTIQFGVDSNGTSIIVDDITVRRAELDRSVNNRGLQVFGNIIKTPVATGADLVAYSGFDTVGNYLYQPYNSALDFGTGDFCLMAWIKDSNINSFERIIERQDLGISGHGDGPSYFISGDSTGKLEFIIGTTNVTINKVVSNVIPTNSWVFVCGVRRSNVMQIYINGELSGNAIFNSTNVNNSNAVVFVGHGRFANSLQRGADNIALARISATAPSDAQIKKMYEDEKVLFQDNAKAVLYGTSDAVTALAYDDSTNLLHAGTSSGRSVFQGLRRVDYTTTPVGAAISASNGMVVEE